MLRIQRVHPDSLGEELGLEPGYTLDSVDGRTLTDFLDWEFLTAADHFVVLAATPDGDAIEYDVERPEGLPMGVVLEPPRIRRCANRCDFCFVDGLPEGLRETLYVRDDDYRLSFRYGNFATLTNLKPKDVERILEYRLSPLYVSVHATDPIVRRRLLRHPRAPDIRQQLRDFARGGIRFHTQIVLQPGLNDGEVLAQSLSDLYELGDAVLSVSVVPVGLTEFSKHHLVDEPEVAACDSAIALVEKFAARSKRERGVHWTYGSDDLYLGAGRPLPDAERYDGFEQAENGVGSVRFLQQQIRESIGDLPSLEGRTIGVLTGTAMGRLLPFVMEPLREATGAQFDLVALDNGLFGPSVTSAGLLPGKTLRGSLLEHGEWDAALLPAESVNDEGLFLDDLSFEELQSSVPMPLLPSYHFTDVLVQGLTS